jgi:hypothetical protein
LNRAYIDYLKANHYGAEAAWFQAQTARNPAEIYYLSDNLNVHPLMYGWAACLLLLSEASVFLLIGGFIAFLLYRQRFKIHPLRPQPRSLSWGIGLGTIAGIFLMALLGVALTGNRESLFNLWPFGLLLFVIVFYALVQGTRLLHVSMALTALFLMVLYGMVVGQSCWIREFTAFYSAPYEWNALNTPGHDEMMGGVASVAMGLLILPALIGLAAMLMSRLRRVPAAMGAVHGFRAAAVPMIALLLLGYVGSVLMLQKEEVFSRYRLHQWMVVPFRNTNKP